MADRPKRPPTGSNDEPYRITRPRIAPPPPLPPRPAYHSKTEPLDEKRAELVRRYVKGEEIPASDEPPAIEEPSFESSARDFEAPDGARIVALSPDMTIRPRRSLHQKIKEWSETASHAQKIIVATFAIGTTVGPFLPIVYQWTLQPLVTWVRTRASVADIEAASKKACLDQLADAGKADESALSALRTEVADAGALQGSNWDKQDEINAHVYKELNRLRLQTPPKPIGPKATGKR